jgi:deoxyribose-phosphate aldolase
MNLKTPLNAYVDHTLLKADATEAQIRLLCAEAVEHKFYAVCVNGSRVRLARKLLGNAPVKIAAVVGFPLGATETSSKAHETVNAVANGADEIDMVMNIGQLKDGNKEAVLEDIRSVVHAATGRPVKAIIETALLNNEQKVLACQLAVQAGASFVKTSTGFAATGATIEDVRLMRKTVGPNIGVKASGGIKNRQMALAMIEAGATRIGTTSGMAIVQS